MRVGALLLLAATLPACGGGSDGPAPVPFTVTQVTPPDNAKDVPLQQEINVVFSTPVDPDTIDAVTIRVVAESGDVILGSRSVAALNRAVVRFLPLSGYLPFAIHAIEVSKGVRDAGGRALDRDYVFRFQAQEEGPIVPDPRQIEDLGDLLVTGRWLHRMTALAEDRFLVAGGYRQAGVVTASAERLFPSKRQTFAVPGGMLLARAAHVQVLMADGRVLLAGGEVSDTPFVPTAHCEIFDPGTTAFVDAAAMHRERSFAHGVLLADGRVLVTGGEGLVGGQFTVFDDAEVYDPVADAWTVVAGVMASGRSGHVSALVPGGEVVVLGGVSGLASGEIFDPSTGSFRPLDPPPGVPHKLPASTLLDDGRLFAAGGAGSLGGTIVDPVHGVLSALNDMVSERALATATPFPDGRVIVIGGTDFSATPATLHDTIEVFVPVGQTGKFVQAPDFFLPRPTTHHAALRGPDGAIWITGGLPGDLAFPALRQVVVIHREIPPGQ